jgi:hypothetical protein
MTPSDDEARKREREERDRREREEQERREREWERLREEGRREGGANAPDAALPGDIEEEF